MRPMVDSILMSHPLVKQFFQKPTLSKRSIFFMEVVFVPKAIEIRVEKGDRRLERGSSLIEVCRCRALELSNPSVKALKLVLESLGVTFKTHI